MVKENGYGNRILEVIAPEELLRPKLSRPIKGIKQLFHN